MKRMRRRSPARGVRRGRRRNAGRAGHDAHGISAGVCSTVRSHSDRGRDDHARTRPTFRSRSFRRLVPACVYLCGVPGVERPMRRRGSPGVGRPFGVMPSGVIFEARTGTPGANDTPLRRTTNGRLHDLRTSDLFADTREPPAQSSAYSVRERPLPLLPVDGHVEACQHGVDRIGDGEMAAAGEQQTHGFTIVRAFGAEHDERAGIAACGKASRRRSRSGPRIGQPPRRTAR